MKHPATVQPLFTSRPLSFVVHASFAFAFARALPAACSGRRQISIWWRPASPSLSTTKLLSSPPHIPHVALASLSSSRACSISPFARRASFQVSLICSISSASNAGRGLPSQPPGYACSHPTSLRNSPIRRDLASGPTRQSIHASSVSSTKTKGVRARVSSCSSLSRRR